MKVLVIDDKMMVRETLVRFLRIWGHEVVSAESGPEGIEKCNETFHLVITDRHMPGMLGEEAIRRVKEKYPQIRAILITGDFLDEPTWQKIKAAGADEIITKSLDFFEKIKQVLFDLERR